MWICPSPKGHIQVVGRDDAGRKQYLYHPRWTEVRDAEKFQNLAAFGRHLPALRDRIDADLKRRGLPRERVLALVARLLDTTLYVTLEPCIMCAGALVQARVSRVVYGAVDPKGGAVESLYKIFHDERLNHKIEITGGVLAEECSQVLKEFFKRKRRKNSDV